MIGIHHVTGGEPYRTIGEFQEMTWQVFQVVVLSHLHLSYVFPVVYVQSVLATKIDGVAVSQHILHVYEARQHASQLVTAIAQGIQALGCTNINRAVSTLADAQHKEISSLFVRDIVGKDAFSIESTHTVACHHPKMPSVVFDHPVHALAAQSVGTGDDVDGLNPFLSTECKTGKAVEEYEECQ